ncbi:hypothetical protein BDZ88DRAFT_421521 [Geranomyces variabilis]|nr:hypothetical protein BDZ88DRAFT_421521 [Geranomyces variabilis]KAJ3140290.1 hypothetical protein HDU90_008518 [Geranomyces variabilis]
MIALAVADSSSSPELRLLAAVTALVLFFTAAFAQLRMKLAAQPTNKNRSLLRKTSKEVLTRQLEKQLYRAPRLPAQPVPVVDTEEIDHVDEAPRPRRAAVAAAGPLARCYSTNCTSGVDGVCYSPSCPRGLKAIAPSTATVEPPFELKHPKRERRMSLFSQILSHPTGAFPASSKIPATTVDTVFYVQTLPSRHAMKRLFTDRILPKYHRFSAIPVEGADGTISWQPYENINVDAHILLHTVNSERDIHKHTESLFCRTWDQTQPMWFVHLLRNTAVGERSAIIVELHHVLGDGISQMMILSEIVTDAHGRSLTIDEKKFKKMMAGSRKPKSLAQRVLSRAGYAVNTGRALAKVVSLPWIGGDSQTAMKIPPAKFGSVNRVLVPVPALSLALIKAIKNKTGTTVNDVLVAALGGAFRRYLEYRSDDAILAGRDVQMRALMPFSFPRPLDDLHNRWTLISARLPVSERTPLARLQAAKSRMDAIKKSPEPVVALTIQQLAYRFLGHDLSAQTTLDVFSTHHCIFTNVPGFAERIYIAGEAVESMLPCVANAVTQVSVVSYCDAMHMTFVVDDSVVLQPERLALFLVRELEGLRDAAGVVGEATFSSLA